MWLHNLVDEGWSSDLVRRMDSQMRKNTKQLINSGHTHATKSAQEYVWLNFACAFPGDSLDSFWLIARYCLLVRLLINQEKVKRLPWEDLLLGILG